MSNLVPHKQQRITRKQAENRMYTGAVVSGVSALAFVATFILMFIGIIGLALPLLTGVAAVGGGIYAKRSLDQFSGRNNKQLGR